MGLAAVAVTDHDTVDGLPEALAAGERLGIERRPRRGDQPRARPGHHGHARLLPRPAARATSCRAELAELRVYRDERNARMLERLAELGMPLDPDGPRRGRRERRRRPARTSARRWCAAGT